VSFSNNAGKLQDGINHIESIERAVAYIKEHCAEPLTREEVCKVAMMSRTTFTKVFHRITGKTMTDYIHTLRVDMAKQLFSETDLSITEVGNLCGFESSTYFGRVFKKKSGMTPREFIHYLKKEL